MSTLNETVSMLEAMPEDARIKVLEFTQQLFTSRKPENPFISVSQEQTLLVYLNHVNKLPEV